MSDTNCSAASHRYQIISLAYDAPGAEDTPARA